MIIRQQQIRLRNNLYDCTHKVMFDFQLDTEGVHIFNIRPNYNPDDGEPFYFKESVIKEELLTNH